MNNVKDKTGDIKNEGDFKVSYSLFYVLSYIVVFGGIIYNLFIGFESNLPGIITIMICYYLLTTVVKKCFFYDDFLIVKFPLRLLNREKKLNYNKIIKVRKANGSHTEPVSLVLRYKRKLINGKLVFEYPKDANVETSIINKLEKNGIEVEDV